MFIHKGKKLEKGPLALWAPEAATHQVQEDLLTTDTQVSYLPWMTLVDLRS